MCINVCVRFVCVEMTLGVVKHPDYLHDSTGLWNFKELLHESIQHVCSGGGGGGGFIHPLPLPQSGRPVGDEGVGRGLEVIEASVSCLAVFPH